MSSRPKVSVIIPSWDGWRDGNLPRLLEDLKQQTVKDIEVIVIQGVSPNGRARNQGVKKARGEIIVSIDDDVRLGHNRVIENLLRPFETDKKIGLIGVSQLLPPDSSWFQKRVSQQISRSYFTIVDRITETDMVSHVGLAISIQLYKDVGWENDHIISGTDPDLRYRVRQAGYKIVVVPDTWAYHPLPRTLTHLLKLSYNKGKDGAWVRRYYPHLVYELADGFVAEFKPRRNFSYRIIRSLFRCFHAIISMKLITAAGSISYNMGYSYETLFGRDQFKLGGARK